MKISRISSGVFPAAINAPIIALTGSNGKTTTKELIKEIFAKVELGKSINKEIGVQVEKQLENLKKANVGP